MNINEKFQFFRSTQAEIIRWMSFCDNEVRDLGNHFDGGRQPDRRTVMQLNDFAIELRLLIRKNLAYIPRSIRTKLAFEMQALTCHCIYLLRSQ